MQVYVFISVEDIITWIILNKPVEIYVLNGIIYHQYGH